MACLRNKAGQFGKRLYDCMQGLGTDDDTLVRVVVSRCEVDMVQIKELFQKTYNQSLGAYIAVSSCSTYTFPVSLLLKLQSVLFSSYRFCISSLLNVLRFLLSIRELLKQINFALVMYLVVDLIFHIY